MTTLSLLLICYNLERRWTIITPCPICSRLRDVETSYAKYLAPQYDRPLPAAAAELAIVPDLEPKAEPEKQHLRRCGNCGTLYHYLQSHEYMVNGTEDEERLTRLTPAQADAYYLQQAARLEDLRREIDDLQGAAGSLGDYIDRGRPNPVEEKEAYEVMERQRRDAERLRLRLQERVKERRRLCPEILIVWANAHVKVCRSLLASLPEQSEDGRTARFVAKETMDAWKKLPKSGETFIGVNTAWLAGYLELLEKELGRKEDRSQ